MCRGWLLAATTWVCSVGVAQRSGLDRVDFSIQLVGRLEVVSSSPRADVPIQPGELSSISPRVEIPIQPGE